MERSALKGVKVEQNNKKVKPNHVSNLGRNVLVILISLIAGFLGAWIFNESDWFGSDQVIQNQTGSQIVLKEEELVAKVAKAVSPSVVSIVSDVQSGTDFFGQQQTSQGAGTGIIISSDGYVLTNRHVVPNGSKNIQVALANGIVYKNVSVVGRDPLNDIAFLKINNVHNLTSAVIGNSSGIAVGQKVVAIGNALGQYSNTVTSGIISGIGRPVSAQDGESIESLNDLLQTDAAINPGNSGGPLVNLEGKVIGINTAVAQSAEGIGFAIPINAAKGLIDGVLQNGKVERSYLGVRYISLDAGIAKEDNLSVEQGAYLSDDQGNPVVDKSPANKAGLKAGDIITKVNGSQINQANSLSLLVSLYQPGDQVTLTILRADKTIEIKVTLAKYEG